MPDRQVRGFETDGRCQKDVDANFMLAVVFGIPKRTAFVLEKTAPEVSLDLSVSVL